MPVHAVRQVLNGHKHWTMGVDVHLSPFGHGAEGEAAVRGTKLASCNKDGTVKVWDAAAPLLWKSGAPLELNKLTEAVHWSSDGRRLASGDGESVKIWDAVPSIC